MTVVYQIALNDSAGNPAVLWDKGGQRRACWVLPKCSTNPVIFKEKTAANTRAALLRAKQPRDADRIAVIALHEFSIGNTNRPVAFPPPDASDTLPRLFQRDPRFKAGEGEARFLISEMVQWAAEHLSMTPGFHSDPATHHTTLNFANEGDMIAFRLRWF